VEQNVTTSVVLLAISSGLLGAVVTLVGGYFVKKKLSDRENQRKTAQLCFSKMLEVSNIFAFSFAVREFIKFIARITLKDKIEAVSNEVSSEDYDFDMSHAICVVIAQGLKTLAAKGLDSPEERRILKDLLIKVLDGASDFHMEDELLLHLPRQTAIEYSFYNTHSARLVGKLYVWLDFLERGATELLTAEEIYSQWKAIETFSKSARGLRDSLVSASGTSGEEAKELIDKAQHIDDPKGSGHR
jgi:hypothetical protein